MAPSAFTAVGYAPSAISVSGGRAAVSSSQIRLFIWVMAF
jgi:hypothetical protein